MPGLEVYPAGGSFPAFTADPNGPAATQPLPTTATGGAGPGSGAGSVTQPTAAPVTTSAAVSEAPPSETSATISSAVIAASSSPIQAEATPIESGSTPTAPVETGVSSGTLPEEFTLASFIAWLRSQDA